MTEAIFTRIYAHGHWRWSPDPHERLFFCSGSRDPAVVEPCIASVEAFVRSLPFKANGLNLGCGDFAARLVTALARRHAAVPG